LCLSERGPGPASAESFRALALTCPLGLHGSHTLAGLHTLTRSHALLPGSHTLLPGSHTLLPGSHTLLPGSHALLYVSPLLSCLLISRLRNNRRGNRCGIRCGIRWGNMRAVSSCAWRGSMGAISSCTTSSGIWWLVWLVRIIPEPITWISIGVVASVAGLLQPRVRPLSNACVWPLTKAWLLVQPRLCCLHILPGHHRVHVHVHRVHPWLHHVHPWLHHWIHQ